jgi:hypothetical protein
MLQDVANDAGGDATQRADDAFAVDGAADASLPPVDAPAPRDAVDEPSDAGDEATADAVMDAVVDAYVPEACTPSCSGKQCGDDGCGGSCGSCTAPGSSCNASGQCVCTPNCNGKQCGDDGCGGSCGSCTMPGTSCNASGQCVCTPNCNGKQCGDDGCGGSCGSCSMGGYCLSGQCHSCTPSCGANVCGSDNCGGVCGACGADQTCASGQCGACTVGCPTLTPVAASDSTLCLARLDDCAGCGPASCGAAHYEYGCWGSPDGGVNTPPLAGCYATGGTEYCCTQAACIRYTVPDSYCNAYYGLPHAYSCHLGATPAAGCVLYNNNSDAPVYCCP